MDQRAEAILGVKYPSRSPLSTLNGLLRRLFGRGKHTHLEVRANLLNHSVLLGRRFMPRLRIKSYNSWSCKHLLVLADPNEFPRKYHVPHLHILAQKYQTSVQYQKRDDSHIYDMVCLHSSYPRGIYPRPRKQLKMDLLTSCFQKFPRCHFHNSQASLSHLQKRGEVHHGATQLRKYRVCRHGPLNTYCDRLFLLLSGRVRKFRRPPDSLLFLALCRYY